MGIERNGSSMGLMLATNISYALGPSFAWMGSNRWSIAIVTGTLTIGLVAVTTLGLRVGKWVQNAGAVFQLATGRETCATKIYVPARLAA